MNKILLIIGSVWPEPKSSAAGSRMMQLIWYFKSRNYTITFASPSAKSPNAFDLETINVNQVAIELNHSGFDAFIKTLGPKIVIFDRFMVEEQFGWRVAENCPNTLRILDTEDLHCLRRGRQQAFKDGKPFDRTYLFNDTSKREIASIYRCDLSLIISEAEIEILKNQFKVDEKLLLYLPFMLDPISDESINKLPKFEERQHFITLGNFLHEPNYDSVLYLKETIWPLIRKSLPTAELHIYGAYASQKVFQLHNEKDGFLIKGFTKDVNLVMQQAKVCLAPLRFGAGLKGKLVDAIMNGTPSIMSTVAAEGMFGTMQPGGFISDTPEEFAQNAVTLYQNNSIWSEKHHLGFNVINMRFNGEILYKKLEEAIEKAFQQLNNIRLNNFTGQMLWHHTLLSTKYMSKWIEEKNHKTSNYEG